MVRGCHSVAGDMDHLLFPRPKSKPKAQIKVRRQMRDTYIMNDSTQNVNVGIAGSFTMIFLTLAVVLLCLSFYRRYKRAAKRQQESEEREGE